MKTNGVSGSGRISSSKKTESAKLASLITLAAGAIAVPQASEADVIVTDLATSPGHVGSSFSPSFTINNLPGTAQLNFRFVQQGTTSTNYVRGVLASQLAGYVRLKTNASLVVHVAAGLAWNQVGPTQWNSGTVGIANYSAHLPNGYDHQYMLFEFKDSTQGNAMRYGWAEISLFNGNISSSEGPDVTIWRYAYENSGVQLATGQTQVPEPSSVALLALGALALGSKGVRFWRRAEKSTS
jgi:hypothetical protein